MTSASIYGCHNQPRPDASTTHIAQAGWSATVRTNTPSPFRVPGFVHVKSAFGTTACQYTLTHAGDKNCAGCRHRAAP